MACYFGGSSHWVRWQTRRVGTAFCHLGEGGTAWVAILLPPPPRTGNYNFLPCSPYLNDFCPKFLLLFSPLYTALLFDVNTAIEGWCGALDGLQYRSSTNVVFAMF
jgi:hypothetical protein